jgi:hypothetical protein
LLVAVVDDILICDKKKSKEHWDNSKSRSALASKSGQKLPQI